MLTPQGLREQLGSCLGAPAWWLGLSGGLDSMVLLELLVQARQLCDLPPLHVIHIHHGLHPEADTWAAHCQRACDERGVPLKIVRVRVEPGASIEQAARDARYAAFSDILPNGAELLLAHHADDQLETMLFRLLRGTGVRGLAGMPRRRQLGRGWLSRPLLDASRAQLASWARQQGLQWIDDPANQDARFARTALRHQLLPQLRDAWPQVDQSLLRLADHAREAGELLDELALNDLQAAAVRLEDPWLQVWPSLLLAPVLELSLARQRNLLRFWLRQQGVLMPDQRHLDQWLQQLAASSDAQPQLQLDGRRLYRSSDRLWLVESGWPARGEMQACLPDLQQLLVAGNGALCSAPSNGGLRPPGPDGWQVAYRQGGEQIKLPGRPTQSVKQLLQQAQIPAWLRPSVPLLYSGGELVSVAGRWNAEQALVDGTQSGFRVSWKPVSD
ncbi:tRNA lysidine(34) synthetase TilS [Halopseudomonas sp.]|uniref:tRNA lysidine(34) synthetase TilS n=1 Tax=Halopseudomonas sp. TaxID=2901191 RepID=UPI00311DC2E9